MDDIVLRSMANGTKQDHYQSVLARMVSAVSQDHGQLRTLIYEFARRKLRKDLFRQFEDGDWSEIEKQISTLEAAIGQIEEDFSHTVPRLSYKTDEHGFLVQITITCGRDRNDAEAKKRERQSARC